MNPPRLLEVEVGASEDAATTFARDQVMLLRCSGDQVARARVWRRRDAGLLLGRFHRADPAFCAWVDDGAPAAGVDRRGLSRRLSGGRVVPVGPGVVCVTLVVPVVDWMDPGGRALRPDQVLNRAVRPLLAMLRQDGVDAFYPGRDLVTVGGRAIAHASFTVMRDGVAVVEMHIAEEPAFADLASLLDRFDPGSVAGVHRDALRDATSLVETRTGARGDDEWASRVAKFSATSFGCEAREAGASWPAANWADPATVKIRGRRGGEGGLTTAHSSTARDFLAEPGPLAAGFLVAATPSMLGAVECSAKLRGDRVTGLGITGDVIAPFHTLDDVSSECEGEPFRPHSIRKALARAMARPRSFLLGLRDLDELILRMA